MHYFNELIGEGKEPDAGQMCIRAFLIFIIALVILRLSGRRSFGMRSPFDNVISVLLGAILSKAVVGSSFLAVIAAGTVIGGMHRLFAWICLYSEGFDRLIKGSDKIIFKEGKMIKNNMRRFLVTENDLEESIRQEANVDSLKEVKSAYVEKNGQISVVK